MADTEQVHITLKEIAAFYKINPRTVRSWCDKGYLPFSRIPFGRTRRVLLTEFTKFKEANPSLAAMQSSQTEHPTKDIP